MLVLDVNILVYANDLDSPDFFRCRDWLDSVMNGREQVGLPWQTLLAFVRVITDPRMSKRPLSIATACKIVSNWLSRPNVRIVEPGAHFWSLFTEQILAAKISGRKVPDVAIACIALEQQARVCTTDRDFSRIAGLEIINPAKRS
jgi:uncharacterized protein